MKSNISFLNSIIFWPIRKIVSLLNVNTIKHLVTFQYNFLTKEIKTFIRKSRNLLHTNIDVGLYHFYKGHISDAKLRFWLIRLLYPNLTIVWYNIGRCHFATGNTNKAYHYFIKTLKLDSNHKEASYYINKMTDPSLIKEVPKNLIKQYFDYTGEYFVEYWLIAKQYRGHELIYMAITKVFNDNCAARLNILDMGCGTGICGHCLRIHNIGNHITGVDISNRMLNIARGCFIKGKPVYNELIHIEMREFLKQKANRLYDVVIFAEVLHYLYDFQPELELAKKVIDQKGAIVCLIRRKESNGVDFINRGDYFCHSEDYVKDVARKIDMHLSYISYCKIYGSQVDGILCVLQHQQN